MSQWFETLAQPMIADSDRNRSAALAVKLLRYIGRKTRGLRGNSDTFHAACTDLSLKGWNAARWPGVVYGSAASDLIYQTLSNPNPSMICRFGTTELATIVSATTPLTLMNAAKLVSGHEIIRDIGIHESLLGGLCNLSGFFPLELSQGRKFVDLMLNDMSQIDILGTWCRQEGHFAQQLQSAKRVRFRDMEPYMHEKPWTRVLAGQRILVIHPFAELIAAQYRTKRTLLFSNPQTLPQFELKTIKAVQSIAYAETQFQNWFEALEHMKNQIDDIEFDIAIIGCGAYGMPLAAHVKRIGKKAVHLGGQTQLLFGIKGKRWETGHDEIKRLFNAYWVYPDERDRPKNYKCVEGGAYW